VTDDEANLDLGVELGAAAAVSHQVLRLYIPDCDRQGVELGSQRKWVLEAAELLARIGGGVTIEPPVEGGWWDPVQGKIVWERPVLVYTYINPDEFLRRLPDLREFLHRLGRETNQGEVALEFDGVFFRIWSYDEP
jgi:hypothetical protein